MEYFVNGKFVWEKGKSREMNHSLIFKASLTCKSAVLHIASPVACRVNVNGEFVSATTARTAHGYCRVDVVSLDKYLTLDENNIDIIVCGHAMNSFEYADMPSCICAEIFSDGQSVAATGDGTFAAYTYDEKVKKTTRFSFQRVLNEVYDLTKTSQRQKVEIEQIASPKLLDRTAPYPSYPVTYAKSKVGCGTQTKSDKESYFSDRCIVNINSVYRGYTVGELEFYPAKEYQKFDFKPLHPEIIDTCTAALPDDSYVIFDMGKEYTGFIEAEVTANGDCTLYAAFDELFEGDDIDCLRLDTTGIVVWKLKKGTYKLSSLEPYAFKYLKFVTDGVGVVIRDVSVRRVEFDEGKITYRPEIKDDGVKAVFDAAKATFKQNSVDIFMDCPSRERAGWLADAFFTARAEYALTGESGVEHDYLQNLALYAKDPCLPDGMLPMCYPSDHTDGVFLPNWILWYVTELQEYSDRSGDRELIEQSKANVYKTLDYFRKYENSDGLLQSLKGWVFIEWSRSNDFVQDISYPTNMMYACYKRAIAALYGDEQLAKEADALTQTIRKLSYKNGFFADNAVLDENGVAHTTDNFTETNQYYAFYTGIATPELYPELWELLTTKFGPDRKKNGFMPNIHYSNALFGNCLRMELLCKYGLHDKFMDEVIGYYKYMAQKTGTLWEHDNTSASCNHGFASVICYWFKKIGI